MLLVYFQRDWRRDEDRKGKPVVHFHT